MDKLTDAEIDECIRAGCEAGMAPITPTAAQLEAWRPMLRAVLSGGNQWDNSPVRRDAARSRAAAILAARAPKRERLAPWAAMGGGWEWRVVIGTDDCRAHLLPNGHWRAWNDQCSIDPHGYGRAKGREACDVALRELGYDLEGDEAPVNPAHPLARNVVVAVVPARVPESALDRLLAPDILRHQPIALQRAIVDCLQSSREVPSRLLWRMELEREPEAQQLRAEVIAGRIRARGWREARD